MNERIQTYDEYSRRWYEEQERMKREAILSIVIGETPMIEYNRRDENLKH